MATKEYIKRYILLIISTFFIAFGIALSKHSGLGVTTVSSIPNVLSLNFTFLSIGNWLNIWNLLLILTQIVILRKDFKMIHLLQIVIAFLNGWFTDFWLIFIVHIPLYNYFIRLLLVTFGVAVLGVGVSLSFIANVLLNPAEALVRVIADKLHKNIGNVKIVFDILCVSFAIILSMLFFDFRIIGVREGTVMAMIFTGMIVKIFNRWLWEPFNRFLSQ